MPERRYQLVIQLREENSRAFEDMLRLENALAAVLGDLVDVDGHDAGSGEINVFTFTDSPIVAFERMTAIPELARLLPRLRVAYRAVDAEDFETLHPPGIYSFEIA
jgi:hypothetical protein